MSIKIKYNKKEFVLSNDVQIVVAPNGFGKTRMANFLCEKIGSKEHSVFDGKLNITIENLSSEKKGLYFSFDGIVSNDPEKLTINFEFENVLFENINKNYLDTLKRFSACLGGYKMNNEEIAEILNFRSKTVSWTMYTSFLGIHHIEKTAFDFLEKYGEYSKYILMNMLVEKSENEGADLIFSPPKRESNFYSFYPKYRDFNYLQDKYFIEKYNDRLKEIEDEYHDFIEYDVLTDYITLHDLSILKNELELYRTNGLIMGLFFYILHIEDHFDFYKHIFSKNNRVLLTESFNVDFATNERFLAVENLATEINSRLAEFGLPGDINITSNGGKILLSRPFTTMSKSEKYRIAFIGLLSLLKSTKNESFVLILDDPFDSLDVESHSIMIPMINALRSNLSRIVIFTHKLDIYSKYTAYYKKVDCIIFNKYDAFLLNSPEELKINNILLLNNTFTERDKGYMLLMRIFSELRMDGERKEYFQNALYKDYPIRIDSRAGQFTNEALSLFIIGNFDIVAKFKIFKNKLVNDLAFFWMQMSYCPLKLA